MILILSIVVKGNQVTAVNVVGMVICLFGLSAHVVNKGLHECRQKKKAHARNRVLQVRHSF
jgi:selenophosphate synthase